MLVDYVTAVAFVFFKQKTAYEMIRYGGTVVTAGLSPAGAEFSFNQSDLVSQEKSIKGSYMGGCVPVRDIPRFIDLYRQGRLPVDRLIDRTIRLEEINAGFDKLASAATVRQIRSEEHTSELQSLMRISYAVFCFNTKKLQPSNTQYLEHTYT